MSCAPVTLETTMEAEIALLRRLAMAVMAERAQVGIALFEGMSQAMMDASAAVNEALEQWQRQQGEIS